MAAQAGPSSATLAPAPLQSFRQLYDALEAPSGTTPKRVVHTRLQQLLPVLKSACEPLQPPSATSRAKVESGTIQSHDGRDVDLDAALRRCCVECSKLLQADEVLVATTMRVFLDTEDVSQEHLLQTTDVLSSPGSSYLSRRSTHYSRKRKNAQAEVTSSFIEAFCVFFLQERLYARRCVSALLRISDDQYNDLNTIATATLDEFANASFAHKCLSLATSLAQRTLSDSIRETPRYSAFWAKHYLLEQLVLLEIVFLLYYSRLQSDASFVEAVLQIIKTTGFGATQANVGFFDGEAARLVDCLAGMQVLLAVESLDVENVISGLDFYATPEDRQAGVKSLLDSADVIETAVAFLKSSTARDVLRVPLMLVWALYLSRIDEACSDWLEARHSEPLPGHLQKIRDTLSPHGGLQSLWANFTSVAMSPEMNLFGTMLDITQSSLLRGDSRGSVLLSMATSSSLALRAVLKGFVLTITELVRPEFVNDFEGLIRLWEDTFDNEAMVDRSMTGAADGGAALCAQFWEVDFEHEQRRSTLTTATRRFPVQFQPLLRLCRALSGSSASVPSPLDSDRAAAAVFEYLAETTHMTHALPSSSSISLPFEAVQSDDETASASYRATRDIPVFGNLLIVPRGSLGRMVSQSDDGPVVITWDLSDNSLSIWRLLRDVLAKFAGISEMVEDIPRHRRGSDATVFADRALPASFALLAAGEDPGQDGAAAAKAMDLISSMLNSSSRVREALLRHLQGQDMQTVSRSQPLALSEQSMPSLVSIATGILMQALVSPSAASDVIIASYRVLKHLTASHVNELWLPLRSSGVLIGKSTGTSLSTSKLAQMSDSSSLLAFEISVGRFDALIALLDFHVALLQDVKRSLLRCDAVEAQIKVDVLMRALRFICEAIWSEYQSWKYVRIRQRIEIGLRCLQIFQIILSDKVLRRFDGPQKQIVAALEQHFASESSSPLTAYPLLEIIMNGNVFAENLSRHGRQADIDLARNLLESALRFATTLVSTRRTLNVSKRQAGQQASLGHVEGAFYDQSLLPLRSQSAMQPREKSIASIVLEYCFDQHALTTRSEALVLLQEVVGASIDLGKNPAPTLMTHLGSLDDIASSMEKLVEQAGSDEEETVLRRKIWNLLAVFVEAQPGLANLIITGKHVAAAAAHVTPTGDSRVTSKPKDDAKFSALATAANIVRASRSVESDDLDGVEILEAVLKFLSSAWQHALEHAASFAALRCDEDLWRALSQLAFAPREACDTATNAVDISLSGSKCDCEELVKCAALRDMCSARSAQLFAEDLRLRGPILRDDQEPSPVQTSLEAASKTLSDAEQLCNVLLSMLSVTFDAYRHDDVRERLAQAFPEVNIEHFASEARKDDFDERKTFGSSYVYDLVELHQRLDGLVDGVADEDENRDTLQGVNTQALLLVASVNLDWTLVDSQTCRLRGFAAFLDAAFGPLSQLKKMDKKDIVKKLRSAIDAAWIEGAKLTADEGTDAPLARDIHMLRVSLLAILQELAWSLRAEDIKEEDKFDTANQIKAATSVILHPLYSVEGVIRSTQSEQETVFCHDIFRMIMIVTRRYERVLSLFDKRNERDAVALLSTRREAEALACHAIVYAQIFMTECLATLHDMAAAQVNCARIEVDLEVLLQSLALLLRDGSGIAVHVWWPKMQATGFLETAFDLFARAPILSLAALPEDDFVHLTASQSAPFTTTLLEFFLDLATHQSSVEHLVLSGVMNALSTNTLSSILDIDKTPRLPVRIPQTSIDNTLYVLWMCMLRVVVSILGTLAPAQSLVFCQNEVTTFFRIFQPFVEESLSRPYAQANQLLLRTGKGRPFEYGNGSADAITVSQLEAAQYSLELYNHILRSMHGSDDEVSASQRAQRRALRKAFCRQATLRLQEAVHLLQHPRELALLIGGKQGSEAPDSTRVSTSVDKAKRHLTRISASIIDSFWLLSDGFSVLSSTESTEWVSKQLLILPSIGTALSRPSTLGTLMDMISYIVDSLRSTRSGEAYDDMQASVALLEQTLSLATTQLTLVSHARQDTSDASFLDDEASNQFTNPEAGLGRDIGQSIELGKSALRESAKTRKQSEEGATSFVDVIAGFHKRWNDSSD